MRPDHVRWTLIAAALVTVGLACEKNPGPQVGELPPAFTLPDLNGNMHALADLRGRVVVLNYWATWCPPCLEEMPSLEKLHQALVSKGLSVIAVSVDERFGDIEAFVDRFGLSFLVLHDNGKKVSRRYQTFKYPETYIIDRNGRLKSKVVGPRDWASPTVIRDMVDLLSDGSSNSGETPTES